MFSLNQQKAIELGQTGEKAIRQQNDYDALQIIEYLREFGEELLGANLETDLKGVIISLRNIGNKAVQKKMENVTSVDVEALKVLAELTIGKKFSIALLSFSKALQEVGKGAAQFQMLDTAKSAVDTLEIIGSGAVTNKMEVVTLWTALALEEIGYIASRQQFENLSKAAKDAREKIIKSSEAEGFIPREQIEKYPQLIANSVSQFAEVQNIQPVGYAGSPNEEFTEEEFLDKKANESEKGKT
jgi:hypothetical protein